jgi:hypothetical protein
MFFEGRGALMPSSKEFSYWSDLIVIRSRERPRDAIQLVNLLATAALTRRGRKVEQIDLDNQIPVFSAQRVQFLATEAELECPQITTVVQQLAYIQFDHGSFKSTFEPLRQYLRRLPSALAITLFGRNLRPDSDEDALSLLGYLFELGVLNARVADSREKDGYRHVFLREDPGLVTRARWNDLQSVVWEVNPAYRDYLMSVQAQAAVQKGLPPVRRR